MSELCAGSMAPWSYCPLVGCDLPSLLRLWAEISWYAVVDRQNNQSCSSWTQKWSPSLACRVSVFFRSECRREADVGWSESWRNEWRDWGGLSIRAAERCKKKCCLLHFRYTPPSGWGHMCRFSSHDPSVCFVFNVWFGFMGFFPLFCWFGLRVQVSWCSRVPLIFLACVQLSSHVFTCVWLFLLILSSPSCFLAFVSEFQLSPSIWVLLNLSSNSNNLKDCKKKRQLSIFHNMDN